MATSLLSRPSLDETSLKVVEGSLLGTVVGPTAGGPLNSECRVLSTPFVLNSEFS